MNSTQMTPEPRTQPEVPAEQGLSIADYVEIAKRRRWLLILTAVAVFAIVAVIAVLLPNKYESRATILIEQPEIQGDLVRTTVSGYGHQQLQVVGQRVLRGSRLRTLIEEFDLYLEERAIMPMDDVVGLMRADIQLETVRGDPLRGRVPEGAIAFMVSYRSASPTQAHEVVQELTTMFLNENTLQRQQAARETTRFLDQEADRLAVEVAEQEARLAAFKEANMHSLPEQQSLNMTLMQRTEEELRRNDQDIRSMEERVNALQSQLAELNPSRHLDRVRALEAEYASLAAIYTDRHPDRLRVLRELETLRNDVGGAAEVSNPAYAQLQNQLQAAISERRVLLAARANLQQRLAELEQRLSRTPVIEGEYHAMTREYDAAVAQLQELRGKKLQAQLGESLEAEGKSERFVLIQPASLPLSPSSPNRPALLFMGLVLALGGGIGTVAARESLDSSIHGPGGVAKATGMPPLAMIPPIWTDADHVAMRQRRLLITVAILAAIGATLTFVHYQVQPLDELYADIMDQAGVEPAEQSPPE